MSEHSSSDHSTKRQRSLGRRLLRRAALGAVLLLAMVAVLGFFADRLLNSAQMRQRIQTTFAELAGGDLSYREIGVSYLPLPAIELRGLALAVPDRLQATVEHVYVFPDFIGIIQGRLVSGRIVMLRPEIAVTIPSSPEKAPVARAAGPKQTEANTAETVMAALAGLAGTGIELDITDGQFRGTRGQTTMTATDLDLEMEIAVPELQSGRFSLTLGLAGARIEGPAASRKLEGVQLAASGAIAGDGWRLQLSRLAMTNPALELAGNLHQDPRQSELELSGNNIDVAAVRDTLMPLAGEVTPITEIFTYLAGGTIPDIHFVSTADRLAALGDWANFRLSGHLADGQVTVPEVDLALDGVSGSVEVTEGILRGNGLSARLGTATGTDGTLALALNGESDLFSLRIKVASDLAETRELLLRLVDDQDFRGQLERITNIDGRISGWLSLGEQFSNLRVQVADGDFQGRLEHVALPLPLTITGVRLQVTGQEVRLENVDGSFGASTFAQLSGSLNWQDALRLTVDAGPMRLEVAELFDWLKTFRGIGPHLELISSFTGRLHSEQSHFSGVIDQSQTWKYGGKGTVDRLGVNGPAFPGELTIARGSWQFDEQGMTIGNTTMTSGDTTFAGSGRVKAWREVSLALSGSLGPQSLAWLEQKLEIPAQYRLRPPVRIAETTLGWRPGKGVTFTGELRFGDGGPTVSLALKDGPEGVVIERLRLVHGAAESAEMKYSTGKEAVEVGFAGVLTRSALAEIFPDFPKGDGRLEGDLRVQVLAEKRVTAEGTLHGTELLLPLADGSEVTVEKLSLTADRGSRLKAEMANLLWKGWPVNPLRGSVEIGRDRLDARIDTVAVCAIPAHGTVGLHGEVVRADLAVEGRGLDVTATLGCLSRGEVQMTGTLNVIGKLAANGKPETLVKSLKGPLTVHAANGVIRKGRTIAAVLKVLNLTEVVRGKLPDLGASGFPYESIRLQSRFSDGRLLIDELVMDGETLDLIGSGVIDLEQGTMQIELLAAPLKTVDSVIKRIPGVNYLLGGSLVTIPLSVSGRLEEPKVTVMSPSAVSKGLLGLGERTLKMPLKLIQSILPGT